MTFWQELESQIKHENGPFWVLGNKKGYHVMKPYGATCSETDSSYQLNADGFSIAKARCDFLAKQDAKI